MPDATQIDEGFGIDGMEPSQFADQRRGDCYTPEHKLICAVLIDAVQCLTRSSQTGKYGRYARDASYWIFDHLSDEAMSFTWICDALEIDPGTMRGSLRRFRRDRQGNPIRTVMQSSRAQPTPGSRGPPDALRARCLLALEQRERQRAAAPTEKSAK